VEGVGARGPDRLPDTGGREPSAGGRQEGTDAPWIAPWPASWVVSLVAHPGTTIPRESKYSRIFFKPNLMRPFTVPSGRSKSSAISL